MWIHYILSVLLVIQGIHCIQFFLQKNDIACVLEYENNERSVANKTCITLSSTTKVDYDYSFDQKPVHDLEIGSYMINILKGSPFVVSSDEFLARFNSIVELITDFAVDWVHQRVYIILDRFFSGLIRNENNSVPMDEVFTINDARFITGSSSNKFIFKAVKVDPYRRFLFVMLVRELPAYTLVIVRSDLNGKGLKELVSKPLSEGYMKYFVDINEMKLFVIVKDKLCIYNYEGELLNELILPYVAFDFTVFGNSLFLTTPKDSVIYEIIHNQTTSQIKVKNSYQHDIGDSSKIRIIDTRAQRRKEGGNFICDRTDCPELCVVESSGDTCVCSQTKAKTMDGVMCYTCGQSNLTSLVQQPVIVNGKITYPGNFPWHAILYKTSNYDLVCGGTLISSQVVLTAAHCVTTTCIACIPELTAAEDIRVALGKTHLSWNITDPFETRRNVTRILVKDGYVGLSTYFANDIALLFLDSKVPINHHIMPACLDYNLNQLPVTGNLTGYVYGFGVTKECVRLCSNHSETLQYTVGSAVNPSACIEALNSKDLSAFHSLTTDKFCMGNGTVSAVQSGDSGGGFTLVYRGLHYVTGVVSVKLLRFRGVVLKYSFGGFTNVSMHMDWLKENILEDY